MNKAKELCSSLGIEVPIFCGAMYPCSNPELVAAASEAGALGIVQPLSLTYVHGYDFIEGLKYIRTLTQKPIGVNLLIEASSKIYLDRMKKFLNLSLESGVKFFVTALGNPDWVVKQAHASGAIVFHDVTEKKWAKKAVDAGVDGLICVNKNAGGHAGTLSAEELYESLKDFSLPLVCAGGVGNPEHFKKMLDRGYAAVQMGTRFLATKECKISDVYKAAIIKSSASDVILTKKLTGVPVAVIKNEYLEKYGNENGRISNWLLNHKQFKHWMRLFYSIKSFMGFKKSIKSKYSEYFWQAGKSVEEIESIESVGEIIKSFRKTLDS